MHGHMNVKLANQKAGLITCMQVRIQKLKCELNLMFL